MSQYNKLSNIQYARFHILPVDLHFETVLVSWYPHHVIATNIIGNTKGATINTGGGGIELILLLQDKHKPSVVIDIV